MPTDLLGQIHSSTAVTSPDWATFRGEVTGMYLLSGQGGEWDSQHLIREYNRNINSLYKSWTPTEPNATGLFLEPYNAGFSYQGTGDFRDYKWDTYSLLLDGVDDYVDAGTALGDALGDNYAGSLTVSLWFKNGVISGDDGLFYIGPFTGNLGPFMIQMTSTNIRYSLGNVAWYRDVGFTDTGSWHHLVCVYAAGSAANSKLYLDGVAITGTISEGFVIANDMDFAGKKTIIGAYYSSGYTFNGHISDVALWNSELSAATVTAIYNNGVPADLSKYSPTNWWRMGEGDDTGSEVITDVGSLQADPPTNELITNGDFSSASGWSLDSNAAITGGTLVLTGSSGLSYQGVDLIAGALYKVTFDVSAHTLGTVRPYLNGGNGTVVSAVGSYTQYVVAGSANTLTGLNPSGTMVIDNFSVNLALKGSPGALINVPTWTNDTP